MYEEYTLWYHHNINILFTFPTSYSQYNISNIYLEKNSGHCNSQDRKPALAAANTIFTYYSHHIKKKLFIFTIFTNSGYCNSQDGQPALSAAKADSS